MGNSDLINSSLGFHLSETRLDVSVQVVAREKVPLMKHCTVDDALVHLVKNMFKVKSRLVCQAASELSTGSNLLPAKSFQF